MINKGPRIDPRGNLCFIIPQPEKKILSCIRGFYFNFLSSVSYMRPEPILILYSSNSIEM